MSFFITDVLAESTTTAIASVTPSSGSFSQILILLGFVVIFYLLLWRPQAKRAKEHRQLMANLAVGDEVTTTGGIMGKIIDFKDEQVTLRIAENMDISLQKAAIASVLPKGTLKL